MSDGTLTLHVERLAVRDRGTDELDLTVSKDITLDVKPDREYDVGARE